MDWLAPARRPAPAGRRGRDGRRRVPLFLRRALNPRGGATATVLDMTEPMLIEGQKRGRGDAGRGQARLGRGRRHGAAVRRQFLRRFYTISFGIRNVTPHSPTPLSEAYSRPEARRAAHGCWSSASCRMDGLQKAFTTLYSFNVIPRMGQVNRRGSRQLPVLFLVESIRKFPDQETFASMIRAAGFRARRLSQPFVPGSRRCIRAGRF